MFTTQNHTVPRQTITAHPTLLLATALLLGLVASTLFAASGDKPGNPPALLPLGADQVATPMNNGRVETFASSAWQAIEQQNAGQWESAIKIWERTSGVCNGEVWKHLSVGVAHLYLGDLDLADEQFALALELDHESPAAHYFLGLLRMEQAVDARDYADAILPNTGTRLINYVPEQPAPGQGTYKAKSRLELEAINEFETAITYTSSLDLSAPLVDVQWVIPVPYPIAEPSAPPTVGELLNSLGADNLAGKAHGLLANLYLDHGNPDQAEYHIDEAVSHGIIVPYAYRTAGELYEEQGNTTDAFRAYMKAMKQGEGIVAPGTKALRSLGSAFEELF